MGNAAWVAASVVFAILDPLVLSAAGFVRGRVQAAADALVADAQWWSLRRAARLAR